MYAIRTTSSVSIGNCEEVLRKDGLAVESAGFDGDITQKASADELPDQKPDEASYPVGHRLIFIASHRGESARSQQLCQRHACKSEFVCEVSIPNQRTKGCLCIRDVDNPTAARAQGAVHLVY